MDDGIEIVATGKTQISLDTYIWVETALALLLKMPVIKNPLPLLCRRETHLWPILAKFAFGENSVYMAFWGTLL